MNQTKNWAFGYCINEIIMISIAEELKVFLTFTFGTCNDDDSDGWSTDEEAICNTNLGKGKKF